MADLELDQWQERVMDQQHSTFSREAYRRVRAERAVIEAAVEWDRTLMTVRSDWASAQMRAERTLRDAVAALLREREGKQGE